MKRVYFGTRRSRVSVHESHEAFTLHSPVAHPCSPWLTLLARCECLKRHGVGEREGELGADFGSLVLPSRPFLITKDSVVEAALIRSLRAVELTPEGPIGGSVSSLADY